MRLGVHRQLAHEVVGARMGDNERRRACPFEHLMDKEVTPTHIKTAKLYNEIAMNLAGSEWRPVGIVALGRKLAKGSGKRSLWKVSVVEPTTQPPVTSSLQQVAFQAMTRPVASGSGRRGSHPLAEASASMPAPTALPGPMARWKTAKQLVHAQAASTSNDRSGAVPPLPLGKPLALQKFRVLRRSSSQEEALCAAQACGPSKPGRLARSCKRLNRRLSAKPSTQGPASVGSSIGGAKPPSETRALTEAKAALVAAQKQVSALQAQGAGGAGRKASVVLQATQAAMGGAMSRVQRVSRGQGASRDPKPSSPTLKPALAARPSVCVPSSDGKLISAPAPPTCSRVLRRSSSQEEALTSGPDVSAPARLVRTKTCVGRCPSAMPSDLKF